MELQKQITTEHYNRRRNPRITLLTLLAPSSCLSFTPICERLADRSCWAHSSAWPCLASWIFLYCTRRKVELKTLWTRHTQPTGVCEDVICLMQDMEGGREWHGGQPTPAGEPYGNTLESAQACQRAPVRRREENQCCTSPPFQSNFSSTQKTIRWTLPFLSGGGSMLQINKSTLGGITVSLNMVIISKDII